MAYRCKIRHMSIFKSSKIVVQIEGADYRKKGARSIRTATKRCKLAKSAPFRTFCSVVGIVGFGQKGAFYDPNSKKRCKQKNRTFSSLLFSSRYRRLQIKKVRHQFQIKRCTIGLARKKSANGKIPRHEAGGIQLYCERTKLLRLSLCRPSRSDLVLCKDN